MRIATFNVENLFSRPVAMNFKDNGVGQPILDAFYKLNNLLRKPTYTPKDKKAIEGICDKYKLLNRTVDHHELILREVRGKLWEQHQDGTRDWIATGCADFVGWAELIYEAIADQAILNTARVIAEVNADIQILVEVDSRPALQQFHDTVLKPMLIKQKKSPYNHVLLMDGNDPRGIDVAILSRVPVKSMKSNIELRNKYGSPAFPRDCAQYFLDIGGKQPLCVFANHFTSQSSDRIGTRRIEQANRVRDLVDATLKRSEASEVVVCGDLNEPNGAHLAALFTPTPTCALQEAMSLNQYQGKAQFPGTYKTGTKSNKLDYLFMSAGLAGLVKKVDVERRGTFSAKWVPFDTVPDERSQASDHHCLWVDF
jgi:endonuclease/exonuclease/phosphatase family metal-dependent hydrolase